MYACFRVLTRARTGAYAHTQKSLGRWLHGREYKAFATWHHSVDLKRKASLRAIDKIKKVIPIA